MAPSNRVAKGDDWLITHHGRRHQVMLSRPLDAHGSRRAGIFVMTIRFDDDASENLLNNFKASMPNK